MRYFSALFLLVLLSGCAIAEPYSIVKPTTFEPHPKIEVVLGTWKQVEQWCYQAGAQVQSLGCTVKFEDPKTPSVMFLPNPVLYGYPETVEVWGHEFMHGVFGPWHKPSQ